MKICSKVVVVFLLAIVMASCAPLTPQANEAGPKSSSPSSSVTKPEEKPTAGGTLVRAMTTEPATIDPQGAPNSGLSLVIPYIFDTLVVRDVNNQLLPQLAESWQVSQDGKVVTMKLRSGVTFHDGTLLDAEAVRFTFQRFKETGQKSPIYSGIQQITGIETVDNLSVRFSFKEPAANFWSTISMPYAGILSPLSARKVVESNGKEQLVGSGPFMLGEWKAGQSITLKRNQDYKWGSALTENRAAPYLDAMVFRVIPEATTQLAALEAGQVDAIFINQPDHRSKLQSNPSIRLENAVLNSLIYLGYNCKRAPFNDVRVRRALSYAVNKDEILKVALGGIGIVASAPLPPSLPGYDANLKSSELGFDTKKAQAGLQDAGFTQTTDGTWSRDGQALKGILITSNRAPNDMIATLLQSQFKAIGVPVEIQQLDSKAVMQATDDGKFDLLLWRYDWNDPDALNIYLGSKQIGSTNRVAYSNPDVDNLLTQGAREMDETKRIKLYVQAQDMILKDAPWQPLYVPTDVLAISKRIDGVKIGYMGRMLVNDARVVNK